MYTDTHDTGSSNIVLLPRRYTVLYLTIAYSKFCTYFTRRLQLSPQPPPPQKKSLYMRVTPYREPLLVYVHIICGTRTVTFKYTRSARIYKRETNV